MTAIGIDLGTTNSLAAYDNGSGEPIILKTGSGETFTPSVVRFERGEMLVGRRAWNSAEKAPRDTVFSIKRLMGRSSNDRDVKNMKKQSPYPIVELPGGEVKVLINGTEYSPEDVSAIILRQVVEDANKGLNGKTDGPITHAVLTVPANFNEKQRDATRKAGVRAGLVIKKTIDEPTAAAVAFGMDKPDLIAKLLVFDMGGGTLDISLLNVGKEEFVIDDNIGDMWLGGDNFDQRIVELIGQWVKQTYNVDPSTDNDFKIAAKRKAEETKILLSKYPQATIIIPGIVPLGGGEKEQVSMPITQQQFENAIREDVDRAMQLVDKVLEKNNMECDDITHVLLVGGATFVPLVRRRLEEKFGEDKVRHDVNPMQAVAKGAAILAAQLKKVECPKCFKINPYEAETCEHEGCRAKLLTGRAVGKVGLYEVTERDFGIGAVDDKDEPDTFSILITKQTDYPLEEPVRKRYMTTSRKIKIPVYAGDNSKASENEYLGLVEYELPPDVPTQTPVFVSFNYDRNRILTVGIEVEGREELNHHTTPKRQLMDDGPVDDDKLRTHLRNAIDFVENMSTKYDDFFQPEQKKEIQKELETARRMMNQKEPKKFRETLDTLMKIQQKNEIVTILHLTDLLMMEVAPETAQFLAEQSKQLRDAYRESGDRAQVNKIKRTLEKALLDIIENVRVSPGIKTFGGLLKITGETGTGANGK